MTTNERARGKWRGILLALGVDQKFLTGKHGPCPFCEGRDRFRWDNSNGNGSFICSQCGAGSGFDLLMRVRGWDFRTAAKEVDQIVGGVTNEPAKPAMDERKRVDMLNRLWTSATPLQAGDHAHRYLASRVALPSAMPACLRYAPQAPVPGGSTCPALIALVQGSDGNPANIHRTFLGPNGKADMDNARAMMPGAHPEGSAVRLFPVHGERLGIAEGIETAFAAAARFNMPVWAALNAGMMAKWNPPAGVGEVVVFGDCDANFTGQEAAYSLARRISTRLRVKCDVRIPATVGRDWADSDAA